MKVLSACKHPAVGNSGHCNEPLCWNYFYYGLPNSGSPIWRWNRR